MFNFERLGKIISVFYVILLFIALSVQYLREFSDNLYHQQFHIHEEYLKTDFEQFLDDNKNKIEVLAMLIGEYVRNKNTAREYAEHLFVEATRNDIPPLIAYALVAKESSFRKNAVSKAGAVGLCQIMPFWKKIIGSPSDNLMDPYVNIRYGMEILSTYIKRYKDINKALAAYNGTKESLRYPKLVKMIVTKAKRSHQLSSLNDI